MKIIYVDCDDPNYLDYFEPIQIINGRWRWARVLNPNCFLGGGSFPSKFRLVLHYAKLIKYEMWDNTSIVKMSDTEYNKMKMIQELLK